MLPSRRPSFSGAGWDLKKGGMNMQEAKGWTEQDTLLFFDRHPELYPIYRVLEESIRQAYPQVRVTVQRTQITLSHCHVFACVSFFLSASARPMPNPRPSPRLPLDSSIPISSCITG